MTYVGGTIYKLRAGFGQLCKLLEHDPCESYIVLEARVISVVVMAHIEDHKLNVPHHLDQPPTPAQCSDADVATFVPHAALARAHAHLVHWRALARHTAVQIALLNHRAAQQKHQRVVALRRQRVSQEQDGAAAEPGTLEGNGAAR
eukprot:5898609-Pleurochrysis_carterae.AAC.2